jgi:hypothetical protein
VESLSDQADRLRDLISAFEVSDGVVEGRSPAAAD